MFVDELMIKAKAGKGGDGVVRWLRERHRPLGGPAGGDGGNGGDVYIRAVRDLNILAKYTGEKVFMAQNGAPGGGKHRAGGRGEDCVIDIPVGSRVTELRSGAVHSLETEGQTVMVLKGGIGGLGNARFKSSTNRSPKESTRGTPGEESTFHIEVALTADVGFVGVPNAGKSTLLNTFTNAASAVGAYPFTTLEPHLGEMYGYVLADIPGLIAGASRGKGLGHKFLRHIGRTRMLLHCIPFDLTENAELGILEVYETIRNELTEFDPAIAEKEEWIVLTKRDLVSTETAERAKAVFKGTQKPVFAVSTTTGEGIKTLRDALIAHLHNEAGHCSRG